MTPRFWTVFAAVCLAVVVGIVLGVRWFGPGDLYEKDQPKTMAYTADVVLHGRFSLPRDVIYQPATKPPLYNWVSAAVIWPTRVWSEWTLKFPSVLGVLATGVIVFLMARRLSPGNRRGGGDATIAGLLAAAVWFTFGSDVRHASVLRLSYLCRPDMLLCAWLTGAWACFALALERPSMRTSARWAVVGWLCVSAAALTKGPAALLPPAYAVVQAIVIPPAGSTRRAALGRLWFPLGVPVVVLGVGAWLACAARQDWTHVRTVILGAELARRIVERSPEDFVSPWYDSAMWFVTKGQPWGALAAVGLLLWAITRRLWADWAAPASYLLVVLIGLSLPAGKRMDYLLPAYAPAAVLVALMAGELFRRRLAVAVLPLVLVWAALQFAVGPARPVSVLLAVAVGVLVIGAGVCLAVENRRAVPLALTLLLPVMLAVSLGRAYLTKSLEAKNRWTDNATRFVRAVGRTIGPDRENVYVLLRGKDPVTTLLGLHQGSYLTRQNLATARYVITLRQPDWQADLVSVPLPTDFDVIEKRPLATLGLYHFGPGQVPVDRLVAIQKHLGDWTKTENPYHVPGTVYREQD